MWSSEVEDSRVIRKMREYVLSHAAPLPNVDLRDLGWSRGSGGCQTKGFLSADKGCSVGVCRAWKERYMVAAVGQAFTVEAWQDPHEKQKLHIAVSGEAIGHILYTFPARQRQWLLFLDELPFGTIRSKKLVHLGKPLWIERENMQLEVRMAPHPGEFLRCLFTAPFRWRDNGSKNMDFVIPRKYGAIIPEEYDAVRMLSEREVLYYFIVNILFRVLYFFEDMG